MITTRLARYERRLLQERARVRADLRDIERDLKDSNRRDLSAPDNTDAGDAASARMEIETGAATATRESAELQQIDDALRILYHQPRAFGKCEVCQQPIAEVRLDILPASRLCSRHARIVERRG